MISPEQLPSVLQRSTLVPVGACCFGDEPQRLLDSVDQLVTWAMQVHTFETRELLVIESLADWELFFAEYNMPSLFASRRVLVVQFSTKPNATVGDQLLRLLDTPNPDIFLVLRSQVIDKAVTESKWFKAWDQQAWMVQAKPLSTVDASKWLQMVAKSMELVLSADAADTLAHWSEGNLLAAKQSLWRWQLQGITQIDMALLNQDQQDWARYDVFALLNDLALQQPQRGFHVLQRLREEGEDAVLILWALARELRLWQTLLVQLGQQSWQQLTTQHRLWGVRAQGLQRVMGHLTHEQCQQWLAQALMIDRVIKGQASGDAWLLLQQLLLAMSSVRGIKK